MSQNPSFQLQCPLPLASDETIRLAHGGGGRLMQQLIHEIFLKAFSNSYVNALQDSAVLPAQDGRLAMTTDSYVIQPLFFPGGDIGSLAVHGTINDLAMMGAAPRYLSAGFILEEGLPVATLKQVVASMAQTAQDCGVHIVCGDTKVVNRGKGDQIFINTTGLGVIPQSVDIGLHRLTAGDRIIVSGDLGAHGMAVLSQREGLEFSGSLRSDSAPLHGVIADLLNHHVPIHCLRDLTLTFPEEPLVWATNLRLSENAGAALVGKAVDEKSFYEVLDKIKEQNGFSNVQMIHIRDAGRDSKEKEFAVHFEFRGVK